MSEPYLIWSRQRSAWWRPNSAGYTQDVRNAGLYSKDEAIDISFTARDGWLDPVQPPTELAIPLSSIPEDFTPTPIE